MLLHLLHLIQNKIILMYMYLLFCSQCDVLPRAATSILSTYIADKPQYAVCVDNDCAGNGKKSLCTEI